MISMSASSLLGLEPKSIRYFLTNVRSMPANSYWATTSECSSDQQNLAFLRKGSGPSNSFFINIIASQTFPVVGRFFLLDCDKQYNKLNSKYLS